MLEPRKADIPALFLVLVVLPVVLYILLGKWSEATKRKYRVNLIAEEAFQEPYRAESMAAASVVPLVVPIQNAGYRECARCGRPSTTRCSRCKSVRYCSGKCQILHWRQVHKEECRPQDNVERSASIEETGIGRDFCHEATYPQFGGYPSQLPLQERAQSDVKVHLINPGATSTDASPAAASVVLDACGVPKSERNISERRVSRKSTKDLLYIKNGAANNSVDANLSTAQHKIRGSGSANLDNGYSEMHGINGCVISDGYSGRRCTMQPSPGVKSQKTPAKRGMNADEISSNYSAYSKEISYCTEEVTKRNSYPQVVSSNGSSGSKSAGNSECVRLSKSAKSMSRAAREQVNSAKVRMGHGFDETAAVMRDVTSAQDINRDASIGSATALGLKKLSKIPRQETGMGCKKVKVLFPFEEFTRFFELEGFDLAPRGLLNCGNSCYANAVLQCLTCTKPLAVFLLSRMHSRTCCLENWCLMCELEQHVMMLKEAGGPLSPSRILSHIRGINCQIGDGSQEDAHEFLRLLVTSMQSICLEEVGGENQVDPILQETTFVQQTFGGRLRSLVVCLKCHHESERYENIMDLTLEIFGWVESLEDALTQFTTPEDLDGENMYRCGRCASYVRARKQLSIDEAPNILTIVLKRFQEGNYGKINKCITFPEMLDMVPFMTGTNDIPPLYMLYGVVVHVDTLNASFSGHYVSYVKNLQGHWFRIDDAVVQPVSMSQVMSEGAYILFYMRSCPRLPRAYIRKAIRHQAAKSSRPCLSKAHSSSGVGQNIHRASNRLTPSMETYARPNVMEISDATSSDWSLFTSSDEASFTSESTRDSFSTTDYSDSCHADPFSSMFSTQGTHDRPSQRTVSCRMFSGSKPVTRYVSEQTGYILDSDLTINPLDEIQIGGNTRQVSVPFNEAYLSDSAYQDFVNYECSSRDDFIWTFSNFQV